MHTHSKTVMMAVMLTIVMTVTIEGTTATELGVNYYHESMMTAQWKQPYIPRTLSEVRSDFDDIKTISNHIKFYVNPFVSENIDWVETLSQEADKKGMHSVVNIMVDDRDLHDGNWYDYKNKVVNICSRLSGDADSILVGNEIVLHSPWSKYEVKNRVVDLIQTCEQHFDGEVGYEAFWYAKEAWYGTEYPIYFMFYENLDSFNVNVDEFSAKFNMQNAYVGEFGEDLYDEGVYKDDWWQKDQLEKRWAKIQQSGTPVAYIFAYREPSWNGFGIVRPDGIKRPIWDSFAKNEPVKTYTEPAQETAEPVYQEPVQETAEPVSQETENQRLSALDPKCTYEGNTCAVTKDTTGSDCRTTEFSTSKGNIEIQACEKGSKIEIYRKNYPPNTRFRACYDSSCVDDMRGYAVAGQEDQVRTSSTSDIASLSTLCTYEGSSCWVKTDEIRDTCRTTTFGTGKGDIKLKACQKGTDIEVYRESAPTGLSFRACYEKACVDSLRGYNTI